MSKTELEKSLKFLIGARELMSDSEQDVDVLLSEAISILKEEVQE